MSKVILSRGLPGSGKTTWAKQYQKEHLNTKRVNRDELRAMMDDSVWSKGNEKFVVEIEEAIISFALLRGHDVIIDDTNLNPKNEKRWRDLVALHNKSIVISSLHAPVEFEVKEFDTPLEECIRRDSHREGRAHVGKGVILNFYNQYYAKPKTQE